MAAEATGQTFVAKCISLAALNDQDQESLSICVATALCGSERSYGSQRYSKHSEVKPTAGECAVKMQADRLCAQHVIQLDTIFWGQGALVAAQPDF